MVLIYIENKMLLSKIVTYFDNSKISYTTDLNCEYDSILCAEISNKVLNIINENKQKSIYFLTYLEENKIYLNHNYKNKISKNYNQKLYNILRKCTKIIVSLPSIRDILKTKLSSDIVIIEKELPIINISKYNKDIYSKYKINKRKKKIVLIDLEYKYINAVYKLAKMYNKYNFIYIGYKPDYALNTKVKEILYQFPKNITLIKYIDLNIFSDISKLSYLIISFEDINLDIDYINTTILFKKQLLIKDSLLYNNYLINSKNCYLFKDSNELFLKFKKIINERVANLSDEAYELIKNNTSIEIANKFNNEIY